MIGEERLAAVIGGGAVVGGAALGPVWGTALDVGSALVTAGIALHGAQRAAGMHEAPGHVALERAARQAAKEAGAAPAAHAMDVLCRVRRGDARAVRSAAMLVGRCASSHAGGVVAHVVTSFCRGLRPFSTLRAGAEAVRAAGEHADLVRAMRAAVEEALASATEPSPAAAPHAPPARRTLHECPSEPSPLEEPSWEMPEDHTGRMAA